MGKHYFDENQKGNNMLKGPEALEKREGEQETERDGQETEVEWDINKTLRSVAFRAEGSPPVAREAEPPVLREFGFLQKAVWRFWRIYRRNGM